MPSTGELILTPFTKAIKSLADVLGESKTIIVRDATIQRFEYTFELAVKMIQRYFQEQGTVANVDALTYNDICRIAAEAELITDPKLWFAFRRARNETSHAYDEKKAENVYKIAKLFLPEAQHLLSELKKRV